MCHVQSLGAIPAELKHGFTLKDLGIYNDCFLDLKNLLLLMVDTHFFMSVGLWKQEKKIHTELKFIKESDYLSINRWLLTEQGTELFSFIDLRYKRANKKYVSKLIWSHKE